MLSTPIIHAINSGKIDADLSQISEAVKQRRKAIERQFSATLAPGQIITLNDRIRPKRLVGKQAKIVKVNQTTASVKLVEPDHRYRGEVRCPLCYITA